MDRLAFKMQLYRDQADEYKRRHDELWPELAQLLKDCGIQDYSIFLDEETYTLFATMKIECTEKLDALASSEIMKKWWSYMANIMHTNKDHSPISVSLKEVFHLP
jgi:L-rhamnose mutarotase